MPETSRSLLLVVSLAVAGAACGGGGDPGPTPLSHHFDDYHIARVPVGERQPVFQAQNDYHIAKGEFVTVQTKLDDNATRLDVAKNELKQAMLDEESAKSKLNNAEKTGDMNRVNTAKAELRAAEMQRRAADQKIAAVKAEKKWLKKQLRYAEENMYAQEARYELAKANVAKAKNIRPKGFELSVYVEQHKERSRRAQRSKALADQAKKKFEEEKRKYEAMKKEASRASGSS
jgi:hypothetical protein